MPTSDSSTLPSKISSVHVGDRRDRRAVVEGVALDDRIALLEGYFENHPVDRRPHEGVRGVPRLAGAALLDQLEVIDRSLQLLLGLLVIQLELPEGGLRHRAVGQRPGVALELALRSLEPQPCEPHAALGVVEVDHVRNDSDLGHQIAGRDNVTGFDEERLDDPRHLRLDLDLLPRHDRPGGHRLIDDGGLHRRLRLEDRRWLFGLAVQVVEPSAHEGQEDQTEQDAEQFLHHDALNASTVLMRTARRAGISPARAPATTRMTRDWTALVTLTSGRANI